MVAPPSVHFANIRRDNIHSIDAEKMSGIKPMGSGMMHGQSRTPRDQGDFSPYPPPGPYVGHAGQFSDQEGGPLITVKPQTGRSIRG